MYKDNDFNGGNRIPSIILVCKKTKKNHTFLLDHSVKLLSCSSVFIGKIK